MCGLVSCCGNDDFFSKATFYMRVSREKLKGEIRINVSVRIDIS